MLDKLRDILSWIEMIGKTENRINDQKKETIKQIRETFSGLAKTAEEFSEKGDLDKVQGLLEELQAAKEKVKWELEKLLKQVKSHTSNLGTELSELATNLYNSEESENKPQEKEESFETTEDKNNKEKALNFIQSKISDQNTLELIKKKINEIEYTQKGIKIGHVEWARRGASIKLKQASKSDFEQSFEWLFGEKLPDPTKNTKGELEYPRNEKIAVIPLLLGWERKGRYGQDGKWHLVWESGFYRFKDERICKFDETGGTIRPKRAAEARIETAYIIW